MNIHMQRRWVQVIKQISNSFLIILSGRSLYQKFKLGRINSVTSKHSWSHPWEHSWAHIDNTHTVNAISCVETWKFNRVEDSLRSDVQSFCIFECVELLFDHLDRIVCEPWWGVGDVEIHSQCIFTWLIKTDNVDCSLDSFLILQN